MAKEYIEREALVNFIESHFPYRCSCDFYDGQKDCINQINAFPAADVVEVVHGEWIEHTEIGAMNNHYECSVCSWTTVFYTQMRDSNYCPNCGAKMDGKKSD